MSDAALVLLILAVVVALFASDRIRMDVVALMAVTALSLSGVLTPAEALAGFGEPVTILIAALFLVGAALSRTGVAGAVGAWIAERGGTSPSRVLLLMMAAVAGLSAFMSSTGAVAVFTPIALDLAARTGAQPARLLMPLAFAALIGGMLTLIGTPPNLIANAALREAGLEPFGFFEFTPVGLIVFAVAATLLLTVGVRLLGHGAPPGAAARRPPAAETLLAAHGLEGRVLRLRLSGDSPFAGRSLAETRLRSETGLDVIGVERAGARGAVSVRAATAPEAGDVLVAVAPAEGARLPSGAGLSAETGALRLDGGARDGLGFAEVVVAPDSDLIGHSVGEAEFAARGLTALAVTRRGETLPEDEAEAPLRLGDVLLLSGGWEAIRALLRGSGDVVALRLPREFEADPPAREKAPLALAITGAMLIGLTLQLAPSVVVVLLAAIALVLGKCLSMPEGYRAINWQSIVLIGGMLPMATALESSGALELIVQRLMAALGEAGPLALMAALMGLTSALSQVISNTATTVLVAPIALAAAQRLGVDPHPMLLGVAIAASTAFSTPVASPVNTLVLGPGGYRFSDFLKVGLPLQLASLAAALLAIPLLRPF